MLRQGHLEMGRSTAVADVLQHVLRTYSWCTVGARRQCYQSGFKVFEYGWGARCGALQHMPRRKIYDHHRPPTLEELAPSSNVSNTADGPRWQVRRKVRTATTCEGIELWSGCQLRQGPAEPELRGTSQPEIA